MSKSHTDELHRLALAGRVCHALDSHIGINDKDLAEFIIHLCEESSSKDQFAQQLAENDADFEATFIDTLYTLITSMSSQKALSNSIKSTRIGGADGVVLQDYIKNHKQKEEAEQFPSLALPDNVKGHDWDNPSGAYTSLLGDIDSVKLEDIEDLEAIQKQEIEDLKNEQEKQKQAQQPTSRFSPSVNSNSYSHPHNDNNNNNNNNKGKDREYRHSPSPSAYNRGRNRERDYDQTEREAQYNPRDSNSNNGDKASTDIHDIPQDFQIYEATVNSLSEQYATLSLRGFKRHWECLLHRSAIQHGNSFIQPREVLRLHQRVYVKVLSQINGKLSVSMRDVDQSTGRDLRPQRHVPGTNSKSTTATTTTTATATSSTILPGGVDIKDPISTFELKRQAKLRELDALPLPRRASSRERWERKQIEMGIGEEKFHSIRQKNEFSNLQKSTKSNEFEFFGSSTNHDNDVITSKYDTATTSSSSSSSNLTSSTARFEENNFARLEEEELDIEINENEPAFLRGQLSGLDGTNSLLDADLSRIVKMPDGSLQRAALAQTTRTKERREIREFQRQQQLESIPSDLAQNWEDPLASSEERRFAADLRSITDSKSHTTEAEWRKATIGAGVTGKITVLSIREQRESLPIFKLRNDFLEKFRDVQVMVVIGETGSGKTTQMTQYLMEGGYCNGRKMIGCTQPRRVAAQSIAKRVAEEAGCKLGKEVGYAVRFEDCTSPETLIKYMTDGLLLREILLSPDLDRYSVIILDEAHERTVNTDILFGLLKSAMKSRPDLKVIITSASLEADKFSSFFGGCHIYRIPGRTFPVTIHHVQQPEDDYLQAGLNTVMQIHLSRPPGDILLFLTGKEEIDTACEYFYEQIKMLGVKCPPLLALPVYSALDSDLQAKIFEPAPLGTRKCVVATNIAEASLTIDGIFFVVDPGFCKINIYDPKLGKDELRVTPISQASAKQRAGRAGRTGPGECYRLYTQQAFLTEMLPATVPEIQRRNLAEVVLMLKAMGINDMLGFDFMDPPPISTMITALQELFSIGALDDEGLLTRLGRKMAEFPLPPQLAKVIISAVDLSTTEEIITIVAMISDEDVFSRPKDRQAQADAKRSRFFHAMGDHLTVLKVYDEWIKAKSSPSWCIDNYVNARAMKKAFDVRKQLCAILERYRMPIESCQGKIHRICRAITSGYFMHAARKDPTEGYKTLVEQQIVYIHPSSSLYTNQPEWIIYHKLVLTTKEYLHSCMVIDPKWLVEVAPSFYKQCDSNQISRRRRREKLEPLHDKYNDPKAWRLSHRKG